MNTLNVEIVRGDTKQLTFNFFDENEAPLNIDSYDNIFLDLSRFDDRQSEEIKLSKGNGITVTGANSILIDINYNQTQLLYQSKYWGDLKVMTGSTVITLFRVVFNNYQSTTKI
ncbi:hypothetical protein [Echinicola shivajiensis]|uniref:hypothetical protein n=1 Tax=Echinicola shivajiensis TaxID=1035916 RepID=UPI001BFC53EE|nr:hypothetical protein [Echinicola shivajiensis]